MADMLLEGIGCVSVDHETIGAMAARYLLDKGIRHFAYCGFALPHAQGRREGFAGALPTQALSIRELPPGLSPDARRKKLEAWLRRLPNPVGLFAAQDPLGREVLDACKRLGLRTPADVAVLSGSEDPVNCTLGYPALSSIEMPWAELVDRAMSLLADIRESGSVPAPVALPPRGIRSRQSTDFIRVSDEQLQEAVAWMRLHQQEEIDVAAVARAVGMDRRALERRFRRRLNRSPKQVLTDLRCERAREMLDDGRLRIGEIAEACGFGASEKLAAAFKQRHGVTPRRWRGYSPPTRSASVREWLPADDGDTP
jgi:LacI family transcriptional regulator